MIAPVTLAAYVERYALEHSLSEGSIHQFRIAVKKFLAFLGREPMLVDLNAESVNGFIADRRSKVSPVTVRNGRKYLLCLWNGAFDSDLLETKPSRISKIKCPSVPPRAWSREQVLCLLTACRHAPRKKIGGIPQPLFWQLFISVTWDTALRCGDALALRVDDVSETGRIVINQKKTGWAHVCQLSPATLELLAKSEPTSRPLLLPWPYSKEFFRRSFTELVKLAGIPVGTSKWLRRASATAVEAVHPGGAMAHLGHRTPGIAYRNYVDPRLLEFNRPTPPPLAEANSPAKECTKPVTADPVPTLPTYYGVPIVGEEVLAKLERAERISGRDVAAALRHLGITYKAFARETKINVKHLGQVLRGNFPMSQGIERKIRRRLYAYLARAGIGGAA